MPNALGGNAVRLGALFGGPVLAAVRALRRPRRRVASLAAGAGAGRRPLLAADRERQPDRPQRRRPLDHLRLLPAGGATGCAPTAARACGSRCRRPPTTGSPPTWRRSFELARGWLRQLDTTRDDIFYDEGELTDATYSAWLRDNAISYVALPDAPLDYSSAAERRLILSRTALPEPALPLRRTGGSTRCATRSRWSRRSAPAAARTLWVGRQGFALDVTRPGEFLVRVNFTPYWSIARGGGCILRRGDWTVARASHPGIFRVDADFSLGRRLERGDRGEEDLLSAPLAARRSAQARLSRERRCRFGPRPAGWRTGSCSRRRRP